jgi:hypothetical protein
MDETSIEDPQELHQVSSRLRFSSFYFSFLSRLVVVVRCVSTCWETVITITSWSLNVLFNLIFFMKEPEREKKESERDE